MVTEDGRREPRLEETKRIARVLRLVQLISAQPRAWTRHALAERFELSERMIDLDLELIRHGLCYDLRRSGSGYYFAGGPPVSAVPLSIPEVLGLTLAAQQARETGTVDAGTMGAALGHLEEALPAAVVPYLRRAAAEQVRAVVEPAADRAGVLALLQRALLDRRRLDVVYRSAARGGAATRRTLAPYALLPYEHSWQVIAHDSLRDEVRMFKADRIERAELTEEGYGIPADFDVRAYLGPVWGILRGQAGESEAVVLRFSPQAAAWVRDERWHPSQQVEQLADGGIELRFDCAVTSELVRWILSFGSQVVVEGPAGLRETVQAEAARIIEQKGEPAWAR